MRGGTQDRHLRRIGIGDHLPVGSRQTFGEEEGLR
jgi:hypothetical protein